jgi:hypothetical protein
LEVGEHALNSDQHLGKRLHETSAASFAASLAVFAHFLRKRREQETPKAVPMFQDVPRTFHLLLTNLKHPTNRYAIKWCVLGTFWNGRNVKEAQRYS